MKLEAQAVNTEDKVHKEVLLKVSFDANQTSDALDWEFLPNSRPAKGDHAGGILFQPGEMLHVEIDGLGSHTSGYRGFEVVDCCLLTNPQIIQIGAKLPLKYAAPSPFCGIDRAVYVLPNKFEVVSCNEPHPSRPHAHRVKQVWQGELEVAKPQGRWELSFIVTVRLDFGDVRPAELRVFSFDPEGEVGEGTEPN
jgi:hypothetical protein